METNKIAGILRWKKKINYSTYSNLDTYCFNQQGGEDHLKSNKNKHKVLFWFNSMSLQDLGNYSSPLILFLLLNINCYEFLGREWISFLLLSPQF